MPQKKNSMSSDQKCQKPNKVGNNGRRKRGQKTSKEKGPTQAKVQKNSNTTETPKKSQGTETSRTPSPGSQTGIFRVPTPEVRQPKVGEATELQEILSHTPVRSHV